jgi:acetone carboxylase gamma subunit
MPYTIYDAIKDEIAFLEILQKVEENDKHTITAGIIAQQRSSLRRILRRVDSGYEYDIVRDKIDGKASITYRETARKTLEEEYPALKKAAEQYQLIQNLVDSSPEDEEKG